MQSSQERLKTMVCAKFGGQTECIIGHSKIENYHCCCFLPEKGKAVHRVIFIYAPTFSKSGHFLVGLYWREIGVRVLQESRKRVNGKLKHLYGKTSFLT